MQESLRQGICTVKGGTVASLRILLNELKTPFTSGQKVGIKLHWGEKGNHTFLPPGHAKEIVRWLKGMGVSPFVFDTTVLYSGSRRTGKDALATAAEHGYHEEFLGCPVIIADGLDGRDVIEIPAAYKHFAEVQVTAQVEKADGFVIFSHFKGHMVSGFGGALKNISMGFASRAQKQRMHADVYPELDTGRCSRCGDCVEACPTGAAHFADSGYPVYDQKLCIGCAQCIALCPEVALQILWGDDSGAFQEKLVETGAALWRIIKDRTVFINAVVNITSDCDCLPGDHPVIIAPDYGFVGGYHPLAIDRASLEIVGAAPFEKAHPDISWQRQFTYAEEVDFK